LIVAETPLTTALKRIRASEGGILGMTIQGFVCLFRRIDDEMVEGAELIGETGGKFRPFREMLM
jgi:hypothetical protein